MISDLDIETIDFDKLGGLVPAIAQDASSRRVLMLGFMNRDALAATLRDGVATFWSRSRSTLWRKGETSGHHLHVISLRADCDGDSLLMLVEPAGPTCHTGARSCFGDEEPGAAETLVSLETTIRARIAGRDVASYTWSLAGSGARRVAQKVGEEGVEVALAAVAGGPGELLEESADLLYHLLVLLAMRGCSLRDVAEVLAARAGHGASDA